MIELICKLLNSLSEQRPTESRQSTLKYLQYSPFTQKLLNMLRSRKIWPITGRKNEPVETDSDTMGLADQNFKSNIISAVNNSFIHRWHDNVYINS